MFRLEMFNPPNPSPNIVVELYLCAINELDLTTWKALKQLPSLQKLNEPIFLLCFHIPSFLNVQCIYCFSQICSDAYSGKFKSLIRVFFLQVCCKTCTSSDMLSYNTLTCIQVFHLFYSAQGKVIKHPEANPSHISALLSYYWLSFMQCIYGCSKIH